MEYENKFWDYSLPYHNRKKCGGLTVQASFRCHSHRSSPRVKLGISQPTGFMERSSWESNRCPKLSASYSS